MRGRSSRRSVGVVGVAVREIVAAASAICERFEIGLEDCGISIVLGVVPVVSGIKERAVCFFSADNSSRHLSLRRPLIPDRRVS